MLFEAREIPSYGEPVTAAALVVGEIYFSVQFIDDELLVPVMETLVFIGKDLIDGDSKGICYFQDAESYRSGIRFPSEEGGFYGQPADQLKHIFDYEKALERLMDTSVRRRKKRR